MRNFPLFAISDGRSRPIASIRSTSFCHRAAREGDQRTPRPTRYRRPLAAALSEPAPGDMAMHAIKMIRLTIGNKVVLTVCLSKNRGKRHSLSPTNRIVTKASCFPLMQELSVTRALTARSGKVLLSLAVPFYNEEEVVSLFFKETIDALERIPDAAFEIVCVNDGSRDRTLAKLLWHASQDSRVRVVNLTRNFGKEAALSAAIDESRGDVVVPFDADLQDPPHVIQSLVAKWREGYEVVLARRSNRDSDSALKRWTALIFYRLHNRVSEVKIPENVGDFRLMSRQVVDSLKCLPETRRFMKGLFAWVGYSTAVVDYTREVRVAGTTKFSGWRLWNFALEGFTSFSTLPLRIWTYAGSLVAILSILHASWLTIRTLMFGVDIPGYASLATAVMFLGGAQLIGIGVLGEYVGRIYFESKKRPVYLINRAESPE